MATNSHHKRRALVLLLLCGTFAAPLAAQAPTPGEIQEQLPRPSPIPRPSVEAPEPEVTRPTEPQIPAGGPRIRIGQFEITGNSVLSDEELLSRIEQYRGQELTLIEIYDIADALTRYYREQGYTLARVTIPAQRVSSGTVRFQVVEGRIGELRFEGNEVYSNALLERHLDQLTPGTVIATDALQQELLLLNDLPGLTSRAVITPGEAFGTSDVLVRSEDKRFGGSLRLNNYGRESIGEFRQELELSINNVSGRGDALTLSYIHSEGNLLNYGRADYTAPVGVRGTRIGLSAAHFDFDVDTKKIGLAGTEIEGDGQNLRAEVVHPVLRSRRENLSVGVGVARDETDQSINTLGVVTRDDEFLNFVDFSVLYSRLHANNSATDASMVFSTNFDENPDGTRNNAQLGKFRMEVNHLQPLGSNTSVFARVSGVYSLDPLMDLERFRIGGPNSVRGFPSAELAGDDGFLVTLQLNRRVDLFPGVPVTVRVFWDGGAVYRKREARDVTGEEVKESLTSVGAGLTAVIARRFTLNVEAVTPTNNRSVSDGQDGGRVWALLSARF